MEEYFRVLNVWVARQTVCANFELQGNYRTSGGKRKFAVNCRAPNFIELTGIMCTLSRQLREPHEYGVANFSTIRELKRKTICIYCIVQQASFEIVVNWSKAVLIRV